MGEDKRPADFSNDAVACAYSMRAHLIYAAFMAVHDGRSRDQFITLARAFYDVLLEADARERQATVNAISGVAS